MQDRRIRHTKKFIKEALLDLLKEKSISKISITELCKRADINRNTFYCHYNYPEDVLKEMEEEIIQQFHDLFNSLPQQEDSTVLVLEICKLIKQEPTLSYVLVNDRDGSFLNQLITLCHDKNIHDWKKISQYTNEDTAEKFYRFTLSGATSIIQNWCHHGFKEPPEEIVDFIINLSLYGMNGFLKK